jgi:HSP20 family molecular chaperone IbpA
LPGIQSDEIEMTYEKGVVGIKAEKKEEILSKSCKKVFHVSLQYLVMWTTSNNLMRLAKTVY